MYRLIQRRLFPKFSSHQSKLVTDNARLYCNHIKPENSSASDSDTREDLKRYELNSALDKDVVDGNKSSSRDMGWVDKLVYSSYLEKFIPPAGYRKRLSERFEMREMARHEMIGKTAILPPLSIKYLLDEEAAGEENKTQDDPGQGGEMGSEEASKTEIQFPYKILSETKFTEDIRIDPPEEGSSEQEQRDEYKSAEKKVGEKGPIRLLSVADKLKKQEIDIQSAVDGTPGEDSFESAVEVVIASAGTADPKIPASDVPCGGCGAYLHCQDQSIPGYISSERFKGAKKKDLMAEVCYRCSVLESHQATLNVNVSREDYPRIVSRIREKFAMILLMVDVTDFPCSIWPGILDIVGTRRPIFLVGNKVDMIPQDSPDYLQRLEESLIKSAVECGMLEANIMHTALISAKTGFGVEKLISTIFNVWKSKGDIFIMGCTNVGKSSLFNTFLSSDLCKPQVYDLIQKATISQWPGTTLNLLKFPMTNPLGWRKGLRLKRLVAEHPVLQAEQKERLMEFEQTKNPELVTLTGYVGKTFLSQPKEEEMESMITVKDIFQINPHTRSSPSVQQPGQWNPEHPDFTGGHWVYDTPGAVNSNQILDLLTLPELMQSLPKTLIQPRTFFINPQMTVFVGGLIRIDFVEGEHPLRYTLFSNSELPVTIASMKDADEVYKAGIGTKVFGVPCGSKERLDQFPKLLSHQSLDLRGTGHNYSVADIVMSSIGWIAVTGGHQKPFSLVVHSPDGKGIFIRQPALLPYAVNWKGKRIRGTYSYTPHKVYEPHKQYRIRRPVQQSHSHLLKHSLKNGRTDV